MPEPTMPEGVRQKALAAASDARCEGQLHGADRAAEVAYAAGLTAGRADERARVVAWLRERGSSAIFACIERGEHLDD